MSLSRVLLTALVLRVAVPVAALMWGDVPRPAREPDSHQYIELARSLAERGEFALDGRPEISRTPGYSAFLAPAAWFETLEFGGPLNDCVDGYAILLQAFVGTFSVWMTARIAALAFDDAAAGRRAAWWLALEPLSILYCGKVLTETLFTACLLTGLHGLIGACAAFRQQEFDRGWTRLALAAIGCSAAMFVRPIAYYWPFAAAIWLLIVLGSRISMVRAIAIPLAFASLALAPAIAWQVRNSRVADYGGFAAIVDENLLFWQGAGVLAEQKGAPLSDVQVDLGYSRDARFVARHPELHDASRGELYRAKRREGIALLRGAPQIALRQHLAGVWSTLSDPGTNAWLHLFAQPEDRAPRPADGNLVARAIRAFRERPVQAAVHAVLCATWGIYWMAAAAGYLRGRSWRLPACWLLLLAGGSLALAAGGPNAYHRMRLPIAPLEAVFAALTPCLGFSRRRAALAAPTRESAQ